MTQTLLILCAYTCVSMATAGSSNQSTLQIVWMVPFTDHPSNSYIYNASSSVAALALGLDTIKNLHILEHHDFNVTVINTWCSSKQGLGALVDLIYRIEIDVVIGPPCAHVVETIAELMAYRNVPIISWISLGQNIEKTTTTNNSLNTFIRTMAPMTSLGGIMTKFIIDVTAATKNHWKRYVVISCEGDDYQSVAQIIIDNLNLHQGNGFVIAHHYADVNRNATTQEIDSIYETIKFEGRIIILVIPRNELRGYMLRAHALHMTSGDYQFLFTEVILASADDIKIYKSDVLWKKNDGNDLAAQHAFQNVLIFTLGHTTRPSTQWGKAANDSYYGYFGNRTDVPRPTESDQYAPYLHDALVLYAFALKKFLASNSTNMGAHVFQLASKIHFKGLSGDVVVDTKGDRQPTFYVYDLKPDGTFHQVYSLQFKIDPIANKAYLNFTFTKDIIWGDGTVYPILPSDTPECGFFGEFCPAPQSDNKNLMISLSISLPSFVLLLVLYILYRWWRWDKGLKNMGWKINWADLDYSFSKRAFSASLVRALARSSSIGSHISVEASQRRPRAQVTHIEAAPVHETQIFTEIARYNGEIVAVKKSLKKKITIDKTFLLEMKHMVAMKHGNLTNFIGVCTAPEKICAVWEYCNKGSLQDVIENDDIRLDTMFKMSMTVDICQGLDYIYKSPLKFHGNLRSSNCVIDNRWVCKLTDFGLQSLRVPQDAVDIGEHAFYANLFWTAPENLRKILDKESYEGSHKADVYALGVIIKELLCRNDPYSAFPYLTPKEIIDKVANPVSEDDIFRPIISASDLEEDFQRRNMEFLIRRCWSEDPDYRPVAKAVLRIINKLNPYKKTSVIDNMIAMMEKYTDNLEDIVAERTQQLQEEKRKTDALLYRMLPEKVAEDLKVGRAVQAEAFDSVTIYFSDIVHFTALASESTPLQIVEFLNALYILFDDIISYYDVYKVETIGDAYMVVSGLPERNGQQHVREIASVALDILNNVFTFKIPHDHDKQLQIRIGLHTGPAVAGVVGQTMPRYCLFGDTVNTASRMESTGKPLAIHMSKATRDALLHYSNFIAEERGEVTVKGKGLMKTYWLTGIYCSGEEMSKKPFHELIKPDNEDRASAMVENNLNACNDSKALTVGTNGNEGKVSATDSGIISDKCPDDKDANDVGNDVKLEKQAIPTIIEEHSRSGNIIKSRHFSMDVDFKEKDENDPPERRTWPKLPTFEDLENDLMNNESDDDVLFEAAVNHFIDQERKISHPMVHTISTDKRPMFELSMDNGSVEEYISTKSKSHSKYKESKPDQKKKKKGKKRNSERTENIQKVLNSIDTLKSPGEHLVPYDASYFSDGFEDSNDDFEVNLSTHSSPMNKLRTVKSATNSPRSQSWIEKSNSILGRKKVNYDDDVFKC